MPSSRVSFQIFARDDLELVARVTVEGALSGLHRSPFHGGGAVFSAADLESVVTKLRAIERPIVPARVQPMRSAWCIVPFAALLSVEWTLRRRRGRR